jgi:hypothetical protein
LSTLLTLSASHLWLAARLLLCWQARGCLHALAASKLVIAIVMNDWFIAGTILACGCTAQLFLLAERGFFTYEH